MTNDRFAGKTVWVVGADLPVGRAVVKAFAEEGASLILSGAQKAPEGVNAVCYEELPRNDQLARAVLENVDKIDCLVVVQPDSPDMSIENCPVEFWDDELSKGLAVPFCASRACMRLMGPVRKGSICFVTSIHDEKPTGCKLMLSVCAGGINMLSREAAQDYGRLGGCIRSNVVEVGPMDGDDERMKGSISSYYDKMNGKIPRGRAGTAEEVASAIMYLSSDEASYVNGATLRVDGGYIGWYGNGDSEARWKNGYA